MFLVFSQISSLLDTSIVPLEVIIPSKVGIDSQIASLSAQYNIPEQLVRDIISCESGFNPNAINNNYRIGVDGIKYIWSTDVGLFQINDFYHAEQAKSMGLDIYKSEDNLEYGFSLMNTAGTTPWDWSKEVCWNKDGRYN